MANQSILCASRPNKRGRFANVTDVGAGMRWTQRRARRARPMRMAKSRGPDASGLVSSSRKFFPRTTVTSKSRSPGRARISLQPSRRESRMPPLHLYARVPPTSTFFAHETAGAARTRLSLRPLTERAKEKSRQTSGAWRREIAKVCLWNTRCLKIKERWCVTAAPASPECAAKCGDAC
jgi:hypothetical protein